MIGISIISVNQTFMIIEIAYIDQTIYMPPRVGSGDHGKPLTPLLITGKLFLSTQIFDQHK
jgi:hypothetical protein